MFDNAVSAAQLSVWRSLKSMIANFLGNNRTSEYEKEVDELLKSYKKLGACMSVKMHFLRSHLNYSLRTIVTSARNIRVIKEHYHGRVNFLAEYCWWLKRDVVASQHKRNSLKRPFIHD